MRILKLIVKNALRHKLRTFLTICGIAIAVMAFGLLRTVVTVWYAGVEASSVNRLITRHAVSFVFPLPLAYRDQIAKVPGVKTVSFANWFGGTYIDKSQFFARLAVDAETFFEVYPEFLITTEELETFKKQRNACIVGTHLVKRYGFKIGDVITLEGDIYPGQWQFVVQGIYRPRDKATDPTNMLFHWQYIDERMRGENPARAGYVGWYIITMHDNTSAAEISHQIDQLFANSPAETKTETEREFSQGFMAAFNSVIVAMNFLSFVIIGIIMLVLGNTMIMAARERTREYAVLKTLGFSGKQIVTLIAGESVLISAFGGGLGVLITFPMVTGFQNAMPEGFFPYFFIEPATLVLAFSASLFVGLAAAVFPIQRAMGTTIVDGLRFIG
jgi:putative ABC transport system permease protein